MAEISNNLLAGLLIVAILVSIVGLANTLTLIPVIQYTGFATTGVGKANVTIESAISITLLRNESIFGPGYANSAGDLLLATNKSNPEGTGGVSDRFFNNGSEGNVTDCTYGIAGDTTCAHPFVVENDGNDPATCIKVYAADSAATFIGGSSPSFMFAGLANESVWGPTNPPGDCPLSSYTDACVGTLNASWGEIYVGSPGTTVCSQLNHTDCSDELRIHFQLTIPANAPTGAKTNTVTVTAAGSC
ncbi:MAG: hypothetical protein GTN38_04855 [Candidatus Aenigmarchaeota archaeon]|nr:hypothetical protein [Candidatus Aenigmarchaeota archaeon]NIP41075.1 hypothetical protein [Candidatus Aenigmarchaeota archaeon]NIQ17477.1 hypothetical protein [Candidatus Aenigmarchaeota archaeon]NIS73671.1 hypothetical protein [Candidatus Aenigmarchaeota archaeon]